MLRPGGVAVVAAISRWASTTDGFARGLLQDADFARIAAEDVDTGIHRNPTGRQGLFTTAYFHRPDDLVGELRAAGLDPDGPVAVEGVAAWAPDLDAVLDAVLDDPVLRVRALDALRRTER